MIRAEAGAALKGHGRVSIRAVISSCRTRAEVIVSFMAVLELIKALVLRAEQDALYGDISLIGIEVDVAAEAPG